MKILAVFLSFIWFSKAYYNEEACRLAKGECRPSKSCPIKAQYYGLCPSQPADIKCCVPYQEKPCQAQNGMCQWNSQICIGKTKYGLCPTQPLNVKCCLWKPTILCEDKYKEALRLIIRLEGKCRNSPFDKENIYLGNVGYTCMGISPKLGWVYKAYFPQCSRNYHGRPALFLKHCFDKYPTEFNSGIRKTYQTQYFNVCKHLDPPAFYVCADISVMTGIYTVKTFLHTLGGAQGVDVKTYAQKLNELHKQYYLAIAAVKQRNYKTVIKKWLQRVTGRESYIKNYNCKTMRLQRWQRH